MLLMPLAPFLVGGDLAPLEAGIDALAGLLTDWQPEVRSRGVQRPAPIDIEANDYESAFDQFNRLCLSNTWGDGLPLIPPSARRVEWMLRGAADGADHSLGKLLPRGGLATLETLAGALVMTGGRPEYLPVLAAAVAALLDPAIEHDKAQATSGSTFPVVVVNGPIAAQIGLNSGFGLLGPDPQHPAGGIIGRALRLLLQNVGGALPGVGSMALFGAMRYTNAVFAEDEAGLPDGWLPLAAEHGGVAPGDNAVTVYMATGALNIQRRGVGKETLEQETTEGLSRLAGAIGIPNAHYPRSWSRGNPGLLLLPRVVARQLTAQGFTSKAEVRERLWSLSQLPQATLARTGMRQWIEADDAALTRASVDRDPWPICASPDQLMLAVAGGNHPTHGFWMQAWGPGHACRRIRVPEHWQALLDEAELERGPGGEACLIR